jgi:hypothetical protein
MSERKKYWILKCPRCHAYQIVDYRNKGKTCSQCAKRFEILGLPVLAHARDAREARVIVADLKMPKAASAEPKVI